MKRQRPAAVVVTDLDNTLYDWVEMWRATFGALLGGIVAKSGLPQAQLETEIRAIHARYGTSEYSFVVQEVPSLQHLHPGEDLAKTYQDAIQAAAAARRHTLRLYPGVRDTLLELRRQGVLIVGYTESRAFYTNRRIRRLDLDGQIDILYSPPDHELPDFLQAARTHESGYYKLQKTVERHLREGELKPDPRVLLDIVGELGAEPSASIYVGDSLMKDVAMAQDAGITDVHAAYGVAQDRPEYELLRRVSHWTEADVERERQINARPHVTPSFVLQESFSELLNLFSFGRFHA